MADPKKLDRNLIVKMYVEEKLSIPKVAKILGCSNYTVYYHLQKGGIRCRREKEPKPTKPQTTHKINENFFSTWSPEMAWVLGLLCTDGCLSPGKNSELGAKNKKVTLTSIDLDVLQKVKAVIGYTGPIRRVNANSKAHRITICRWKIYDDLVRLGLTPRKSLTLKWPEVPHQFMRHFIRGVFEGDGCFHLKKDGTMCISLVSGSDEFILGAKQELSSLEAFSTQSYSLHRSVISTGKNPLYRLAFAARSAVEEFYWKLYESVPCHLSMARKREAIESFLNKKLPDRLAVQPMAMYA